MVGSKSDIRSYRPKDWTLFSIPLSGMHIFDWPDHPDPDGHSSRESQLRSASRELRGVDFGSRDGAGEAGFGATDWVGWVAWAVLSTRYSVPSTRYPEETAFRSHVVLKLSEVGSA